VSAGSAATTNTVTITNTVGSVVVLYVEPWLSTTSTIRIGNAGRNGSSTAGWIDNTLGICSTASLTAYAANLYVLSLGINDAAASTPVATFRANMESIIATCQAAGGDVILWTPQAVNDPTREAVLATYRAVYPSIAAQHGCFFTDVHSRFPAYDAGWYSDNYHLNGAGYYDEAEMFAAALSGI
jgi:lysophospholipase L1-like esterase